MDSILLLAYTYILKQNVLQNYLCMYYCTKLWLQPAFVYCFPEEKEKNVHVVILAFHFNSSAEETMESMADASTHIPSQARLNEYLTIQIKLFLIQGRVISGLQLGSGGHYSVVSFLLPSLIILALLFATQGEIFTGQEAA